MKVADVWNTYAYKAKEAGFNVLITKSSQAFLSKPLHFTDISSK